MENIHFKLNTNPEAEIYIYTASVQNEAEWEPGLDINVCPIVQYQWKLIVDK
jgi:hypothetical protein